jgi:hypothetical protein
MAIKNGNVVQAKTGTAAYTDTTAKITFTLPASAMIIGVRVFGTASNAGTTGVLTLKNIPLSTGTPATFAVIDVKTALSAVTGLFAVTSLSGIAYSRAGEPQQISATYSETGGAGSAGSFTFVVEYL